MPFVKQDWKSLARQSVEDLSRSEYGVYGLAKDVAGETYWVYVGKGNIRDRLLNYLNGDNSCITKEKPTHWKGEIFEKETLASAREKVLIKELQPSCNKRVG